MPRAVNMFGTDSPVANRRIHPEQDRTDKQCDSYEQDIPPYEAPYPVDCTTAYRTTYYKVEINIEYRYEYSAFYVEYMKNEAPRLFGMDMFITSSGRTKIIMMNIR